MSHMVEAIEVDVPASVAYSRWAEFTAFPQYMESVEKVQDLDPTHVHWKARILASTREWDAEITEQVPGQRISWRAQDGPSNSGTITFDPLGPQSTKIEVQMDFEPEGVVETVGDKLGVVQAQVRRELMNFRDFVDEHPLG